MVRVGLLRKAGLFDEAAAVARRTLEQSPDWHSTTSLGLVLREKGDCEGAEDAFRQALELDPSDYTAALEAGDLVFNRQEWQRAIDWYQIALGKEAGQPWAIASVLYCRWKLSGDDQLLKLLYDLAEKENPRAQSLYHQTFRGGLPEPSDATANLVRQMRNEILTNSEKSPTGEMRTATSSLEAPSNYLAFRIEMEGLGWD